MIQVVAIVQVLAGAALLIASFVIDLNTIVAPAMGIVFLLIGLLLFVMVANARLSDRIGSVRKSIANGCEPSGRRRSAPISSRSKAGL